MMQFKRISYLFAFLLVLTRCIQPTSLEVESTESYPPAFLFATENGELRLLNMKIVDEDTTIYQIERYGNIGAPGSFYGQVDLSWYNAYAINRFDPADTVVKVAAVLNKMNNVDPAYNRYFKRQFIQINEDKRTLSLQYFSFLNNRFQMLEQWNYPLNGDRAVTFINKDSYLVLFSDRWEKKGLEDKPVDVPYSGKALHLIRYNFNSPQPELGEVITTFSIGDGRVDIFKDKPTAEGVNHLHSTANGEFYVVWAPYFNQLGYSPYIIRPDGTMAFNPNLVDFTWANRYFGQSMFAFEPHPTKDSVFVIGDVNYKQVKLVELPTTLGQRFTELRTKSITQLIPSAAGNTWAQFQRARAWYMKFNHSGTHLAVTHSLPGANPTLAIWDTETDQVKHYEVNRPGSAKTFSYMGKPAWYYAEEGKNRVYFMAGDTVGVDHASFFYVDLNQTSTFATEVDNTILRFKSNSLELPTKATDLVGR